MGRTKKSEEVKVEKEAEEKISLTKSELDEIIRKAVENAAKPAVQIIPQESVKVMFLGGIAKGTSVRIGKLGNINRDGGILEIPKRDFLQGITETVDELLAERKLIVLEGLSDEERERYGVLYDEKELLTQKTFTKLLDYGEDEICGIFSNLCEQHKSLVAKMFMTAWSERNDSRVTIPKCRALNKISKLTDKEGLFTHILQDMGNKISE